MIKLFTIALFLIGLKVNAQLQVLKASTDKFITVQFPSKVDFYQNSVSIHDKVGIRQVDDILFIQFLEPNVQETNLFVKTVDNKTYNFLLQYHEDPTDLTVRVDAGNITNESQSNAKSLPVSFNISQKLLNESGDRKSTRLNSSHVRISYAVFCLKKKKNTKKKKK